MIMCDVERLNSTRPNTPSLHSIVFPSLESVPVLLKQAIIVGDRTLPEKVPPSSFMHFATVPTISTLGAASVRRQRDLQ